ncbi:MAG: tetratricopeptide repeat protein, partial [Blastocatellia bacterium]
MRLALEKYRSAAASFKQARDKSGEARARLGAGEVLAILGVQEEALSQCRIALRLVSGTRDTKLEVDILNGLAQIEIDRNDRACEAHSQRSLDLALQEGYALGQAGALNNLGVIARNEPTKAIDYFSRALSLWTSEASFAGQAEALTNLGLTYGDSGSVDRAKQLLQRALEAARAAADVRKEARISLAIALVHTAKAEWQRALDLFQRTISLLRQFGDRVTLPVALNGLGSLYEELGESGQALANFNESRALSQSIDHQGLHALALRHIAGIYADTGHRQKALRVYRELVRTTRSQQDYRLQAY